MAFIEKLDEKERELVTALPYKAGVWVSATDGAGGDMADFREDAALKDIIEKKAKEMFPTAFIHEVMVETYSRRSDWSRWKKAKDSTLDDCRNAVAVIEEKISQADADAYRKSVMEIGFEVAKAFSEYHEGASLWERLTSAFRIMGDKIVGLFRGQKYVSEQLLRVSYEEDVALSRLAAALQVKE